MLDMSQDDKALGLVVSRQMKVVVVVVALERKRTMP